MGLSEVLNDLIRIEQLKEIRRKQATRSLEAPEAAGQLFEQYPGGVVPPTGTTPEAMGPNLADTLEGFEGGPNVNVSLPGGLVAPPIERSAGPTQVPLDVERAFGKTYDTPLSSLSGTATPTGMQVSRERAMIPPAVEAQRAGMPGELEQTEAVSQITLKRQKELADYMKKLHPERDPGARTAKTRENALFDDLYTIQNWHVEQMHAVRQDPRAQKNPENMKAYSKEVNETLMGKVRALENQYPDLIMKNERAKKSISKLKALSIISPVYPERKK